MDLTDDESVVIVMVEEGNSSEFTPTEISRTIQKHNNAKLEGKIKGSSPPREINHKINFMSRRDRQTQLS